MFSVFYDFSTVKIYLAARQLDNGIFTFIASAENGVDTIDKLFGQERLNNIIISSKTKSTEFIIIFSTSS